MIPIQWKAKIATRWAVLLLIWALFAQATLSAAQTSLTIDEGLHITSGYTILRTGDYRLVEEHPPLVKMWMALPLLPLRDLPDPASLLPWETAARPTTESLPLLQMTQQLLYTLEPFEVWVYPARAMSAMLAVLLAAAVWRWTSDLGGRYAGLLALFLMVFDPNILAHAAVAGTDLGATFFILLALFCMTRYLRRPGATRLLLAGVTLGLAQGAKLSALLLLPVSVVVLLLARHHHKLRNAVLYYLAAGLTLWALYGFQIGHVPGVPIPLPAAHHAIPWFRLQQHAADGHAAFLLGKNSQRGWWYYFPVAFVLKTPLPALVLLAVALRRGLASWVRNGRGRSLLSEGASYLALSAFALIYIASSLLSPLNIGYRHLLPLLPLMYIGIGTGVVSSRPSRGGSRYALQRGSRALLFALGALSIWQVVGTLRLHPHYLAFFNEIAGGPSGGWRYLADSNTDWGQAYKDLARFQREQGLGTVRLSAFIFYDPAVYGVDYEPLTPLRGDTPAIFPSRLNPPPGDYVLSATTLDGIPLVDPEMYDWFRKREPDARIAHVLFYYHIPERETEGAWLTQCNRPVVPLPDEKAREGLGRSDLRMLTFDCAQAWVYPGGGQSAGWYARYLGSETDIRFIRKHLSSGRLAYEQHAPRDVPPFALYELEARPESVLWDDIETGAVLPSLSDLPPQAWEPEEGVHPPIEFDGPLIFLGHRSEPTVDAQVLAISTYWAVTETTARPFSLMAHLVDSQGELIAVGDGLGVAPAALLPGDVIVQRHAFMAESAKLKDVCVRIGAYWLDTMERWVVVVPDGSCPTQFYLDPETVRDEVGSVTWFGGRGE